MAEIKSYSQRIIAAGLYRVGYKYSPSLFDWLFPLKKKYLRFDVLSDHRFSFSTVDHPVPALFGSYEKEKSILVELKAGELLTLKVSGIFSPKRIIFIVEDPGTFNG